MPLIQAVSGMMLSALPVWIWVTEMVAADDGLDRLHDPAGRDHRVARLVRHRAVAAKAAHMDRELVHRRHDRPRRGVEIPHRGAGRIVQRIDLTDAEAFDHALSDHGLGAAAMFLGRLEDQRDCPREGARLGQVPGRAEEHRRMPVMAAGMHPARPDRGMGKPSLLPDRQRIHVGAQADDRARGRPLPPDQRHDARGRDSLMHLVHAEFAQPRGDKGRRLVTVERELGMHVKVPPPGCHLLREIGDAVDHGHGRPPAKGAIGLA